jgi:hypothetical protein
MGTIAEPPQAFPHHYAMRTSTTPAKVILWMVAVPHALLALLNLLVALHQIVQMGRPSYNPFIVLGALILVGWSGFWSWLALTATRQIDQLRTECFEAQARAAHQIEVSRQRVDDWLARRVQPTGEQALHPSKTSDV